MNKSDSIKWKSFAHTAPKTKNVENNIERIKIFSNYVSYRSQFFRYMSAL